MINLFSTTLKFFIAIFVLRLYGFIIDFILKKVKKKEEKDNNNV